MAILLQFYDLRVKEPLTVPSDAVLATYTIIVGIGPAVNDGLHYPALTDSRVKIHTSTASFAKLRIADDVR